MPVTHGCVPHQKAEAARMALAFNTKHSLVKAILRLCIHAFYRPHGIALCAL